MSELSAHELLVWARNDLAKNGVWGTSDGPKDGTTNCSVLAVDEGARSCDKWENEALDALTRAAGLPSYRTHGSTVIYNWNDSHTQAEVLAAFDKAIASTAPCPADPLEGVEMAEVVA